MKLTYDGYLGIGKSNPSYRLHVGGSSSITNSLYVGNTLQVTNAFTCPGTVTLGTVNVNSISASLFQGNVYTTSGVSTFKGIDVTNFTVGNIGIGTTNVTAKLVVYDDAKGRDAFSVSSTRIGIFTGANENYSQVQINALGFNTGGGFPAATAMVLGCIGIGTTNPSCGADFSCAGQQLTMGFPRYSKSYLLVPRVTASQRSNELDAIGMPNDTNDNLKGEGALIYNLTTKQIQGYAGGSWWNLTTNLFNGTDLNVTTAAVSGFATVGNLRVSTDANVSGITTTSILKVGTGVTASAGVVTATNGFSSGVGSPVKITVVGNRVFFTVGAATTSLTLF